MGGSDLNASLVVHRTVLTVLEASGLSRSTRAGAAQT